ncbi:MAG: Tfp pilus assembly protein tip-associated adhesin PilY1-like protein [Deltaproteobacteria bacterium]|nr:Tfp pilus assembly protein tip-associated adhesin PilY1-like protein [Deltaproteobacteria bacterium]
MKRSRNSFLWTIRLMLPCAVLALANVPSESAVLEQYCQYPPYVIQSVLPSVTMLVSNSQSMLNFAYGDGTKLCDSSTDPCGGFDPARKYYGLFDSNYWYTGATGGGGGFTKGNPVSAARGTNDWHGNFLNWLTTRRVDVLRKVLTGGTGAGNETCGANNAIYKIFDDNRKHTPYNTNGLLVTFNKNSVCGGTLLSQFTINLGGSPVTWNVRNLSLGTTSGIIQEATPKASLGIAFYNESDSQGAGIAPQVDGSNIPISAYRNRIDTPSRFNGVTAGQPLGEALWTIVGQYARVRATDASNGPRYHNLDYNPDKDPYLFHGIPSRCVKGSVIIISDGEACKDGSLPTLYGGADILNFADNTPFNCRSGDCLSAPGFTATTIPSCTPGGAVGGLEDVALFAHTRDLRSATFGESAIDNKQNLDIYVIRAFGSDISNLLKYAAINGTFLDANGNGVPDAGEYGLDQAYFQADDGAGIEQALRDILENILKRATSGTAASVLASGEGSGANLIQAVFYPRRRFFDEVVEWTGTLQNLWYYVDPFIGSASIREDSDKPFPLTSTYTPVLNLVTDNTVEFFFDQASGFTMANEFANDPSTGNKTGTPAVIRFEDVQSIWEAGAFLHSGAASSRTIFTAIDNAVPRTKLPFTDTNASTLQSSLAASSAAEATSIIRYVRGMDDVDSNGVIDYRQRTVPFPANSASDNTTWKLGDIINSTPKIASRVPINTYDLTYNDTTYREFTRSPGYRNRGMVFVGANDGMLHAFKLGKLEFPGDNTWNASTTPAPAPMDKVRLWNLDTSVPLGQERWAFIPKNALPYLKALLDNNYCHLYYVDQASQLFDASIGPPTGFVADNATRTPASWRTILIGGMRLGGACAALSSGRANAVDLPVSGIGYSSYFAIDVTNPESPSVLWEFSDPALGFATTGPAILRVNDLDRTRNGKWFVVFGSGPTGPISNRQFMGTSDQTLKLFVVDLKTGAKLRTIEPRDSANTAIANAFAGSMINATADFNLDYQDDALYLGYVRENTPDGPGVWNQGGVLRLQTNGDVNPANWTAGTVIEDIGPVTSSVVRLQNNTYHTNWLYFGSGRYYFTTASLLDDPSTQRKLFGVREPCFVANRNITSNCTSRVDPGTLINVGDTTIIAEGTANMAGFTGWSIGLDNNTPVDYDGAGAKNYQAERVITDPLAVSSGIVFFTTFRPYGDDCAIGGRTFLWAVRYNTGGAPSYALQGKALMQVSTASVEQLDLGTAFSGNDTIHRGGRRSFALEGVPPTAQGLSLMSPPPPVRRILHMKER